MNFAISWLKRRLNRNRRVTVPDAGPWFVVETEGLNVWLREDDQSRRYGFYKVLFLQAVDEPAASSAALAQVQADLSRKGSVNAENDPPRLVVEDVGEIDFDDVPDTDPGYAFFPDEEEAH
jgi:hypothetical protein